MTTRKHEDFVKEPMGDKPVTKLPGIGPNLGMMLQQQGYDKAYLLLAQFLLRRKDTGRFSDWLRRTCGAPPHHARSCAQCLRDYCYQHL